MCGTCQGERDGIAQAKERAGVKVGGVASDSVASESAVRAGTRASARVGERERAGERVHAKALARVWPRECVWTEQGRRKGNGWGAGWWWMEEKMGGSGSGEKREGLGTTGLRQHGLASPRHILLSVARNGRGAMAKTRDHRAQGRDNVGLPELAGTDRAMAGGQSDRQALQPG
ncbi:hypothetical protein BC834DRAFT_847131 [Gloeopeniophorella convolvens]|nr:hypothetical protein BC834DRAFT_847131 [Gloeopeniophorella convolvens]